MFRINVTYKAKDGETLRGFYDEITEEGIAAATRKEEGCMLYEFYFSAERDNELMLMEKWADRTAQEHHDMMLHMAQLADVAREAIAGRKTDVHVMSSF